MKKDTKIKIGYLIKGYFTFLGIVGAVLLVLGIILMFVDKRSGLIMLLVAAAYIAGTVVFTYFNTRDIISNLLKFGKAYGGLENVMISDFPVPYAVTDRSGEIIAYNENFSRIYDKDAEHNNICDLFHDLKREDLEFLEHYHNLSVFYDNRNYRIHIRKLSVDRELQQDSFMVLPRKEKYIFTVYLFDETEVITMMKKLQDERMTVALICIDNYDEVHDKAEDKRKSMIFAEVDKAINEYFHPAGAIVRKTEKDRYFIVFKQKYLAGFQRSKFDILDKVKDLHEEDELEVTLSIGIAIGSEYLSVSESAHKALELALGRGGDQAVVRDGERLYYYGGKNRQVEKNSRVKARMKGMALKEIIKRSERVVIMGHKTGDMDSFGASIGICKASRSLGKKAYIVLNELNNSVKPILDTFTHDADYESGVFITPAETEKYVDENTTLIIVDVNKPDFFECPDLVNRTKIIVMIDHHMQSGDRVDDLTMLYHEPTASSTCEMVCEIIQYVNDNIKLKKNEAEALYAGILIDTNYFSKNTGVRTFEAAAFLKKNGVDVANVKAHFNDSLEEVKVKAEAIRNTEIIAGQFAVSVCPSDNVSNPSIMAAQVANELLDVAGINASFVMTGVGDIISISARSRGNINVQQVMERMGGGGHMNMAGAQVEGTDMEETAKIIKTTIKKMIEEGKL